MNKNIYAGLEEKLNAQKWPAVYLFKFIVPSNTEKINAVKMLFDDTAEFLTKSSKTKKYISVSVKKKMLSVESIIAIYKEAHKIEGLIAL